MVDALPVCSKGAMRMKSNIKVMPTLFYGEMGIGNLGEKGSENKP